jgi:beta-lactamase regulating signal transducer with metallopeptidase domain
MSAIVIPLSIARIAESWSALFLPVVLKGSVLLALLLLAGRLMRSASASARHLVWFLGTIGLLLLPVLEAGIPSWKVVPVPGRERGSAIPGASGLEAAPATVIGAAVVAPAKVAGGDISMPALVALGDISARGRTRDAEGLRAQRQPEASVPLAAWCFSVWLSGILLLALVRARGMAHLGLFQREARPPAGGGWPQLLRSLCQDLGVATPPALLVSPRALAPMTWGLRRPVVLLPRDCHGWSEDLRRQVLLHELAHVRRRDCLTQLVAQCACLLHWFNPLVWVAARRLRGEREGACDDLVLGAGALPSSYANHLLQIASHLGARKRTASAGLAMARRSGIFDRLDAVLDARRCRRTPSRRAVAVAGGLILAFITGLSALGPATRAHGEETSRPTSGGGLPTPPAPGLPSTASPLLDLESGLDLFSSGRPMSCEYEMNGVNVKVKMEGRIQFTEDYSGIVRLDPDAGFVIQEKRGRRTTSLRVEPGAQGQPVYHFQVGRDSRPFDSEGAAWLAHSVEFLMLVSGMDADVRVRRAYEQGGLRGVLALIDQAESEIVQGTYYGELFALDNLRDDEVVEVLQRIPHDIHSETVRASTLVAYADNHLRREGTRDAFLGCLSSLKSDFEKSRVLQSGLDREGRTPGELAVLLAAAKDLKSDYEAGQFLAAFRPDLLADEGARRAYFATLDDLDSDFEQANVLATLVRRAGSDETLRTACLEAAQRIGSGYEYARVMRTLR